MVSIAVARGNDISYDILKDHILKTLSIQFDFYKPVMNPALRIIVKLNCQNSSGSTLYVE